ncbi:ABC transporter ATP-binding protein [Malikia sp.]|uniref:ABC transporter ATP-binding protein n=1 Tax=Malikia sp. TaxID=2070706 RepID=UPI002620D605|nr:ATP-binding cassette domain-containing protein [Malikia sp.]
MPLLTIEQAGFAYADGQPVLHGIDLQIEAGRFHCLLGRSGCGKTSLLKLAAGLLLPSSGRVIWRGKPVRGPLPEVAFVFQRPTLLDWLSVLDNVLLPVSLKQRVTSSDRELAQHWLQRLGIAEQAQRRPSQLSGGQQSRVAVARAWMQQPALLCMDEPFAALDALTREELQQDLLAVCAEQGSAVLFVTHDLSEAAFLGDQVSLLDRGRLQAHMRISAERPRSAQWRDADSFHAQCASLRRQLELTR